MPPDPRSIRIARDFVRDTMATWGMESADAVLMTSELVTNAVRDALAGVTVRVRRTGPRVRIEVHDDSPLVRRSSGAADTAADGRGLGVVHRASDAWGVESHRANGRTAWFEVAG